MSDYAAFRDAIRTTLDREMPIKRVRAILESAEGHDAALWSLMAELGWLGIHIPERYGGLGGGFVETCLVLQELGRKTIPTPYFSSAVLASGALLGGGNERLRETYLPRLATGAARGTLAFGGASGQLSDIGYRCRSRGEACTLGGRADFVLDAHLADFVVVHAHTEAQQPVLFLVDVQRPEVDVTLVPSFDLTRRFCRVAIDDLVLTDADRIAGPGDGAWLFDHVIKAAGVGLAAESVGGAEHVLEETVAYVKTREQFGRAIGSFQAVKHGCAEMLLLVESARVAAEHAAQTVNLGTDLSSEAAFIAKSYAVEAYYKVVGSGMQYHGGIGFTWDHDVHVHFKRATLARSLFGASGWHLDRLADSFLPERRAGVKPERTSHGALA